MPSRIASRSSRPAWSHMRTALNWLGPAHRRVLLQIGVLLLLALATTWLLQRGRAIDEAAQLSARGRSLAELVAQAVGPQVSFEDSPRLLRILECAAREGHITAGAVLDSSGNVLAHTDVARTGMRILLPPLAASDPGTHLAGQVPMLFGQANGKVLLQPLVSPHGPAGTVALLVPEPPRGIFGRDAMRIFLPAALLLLAFVGLTQATIRWAVRPTAEFLERLAHVLERKAEDGTPDSARSPCGDRVMEDAVTRIHALSAATEKLTIENRVLDYERKRMALILDRLPDGMIVTDALGKVILVNRAAAGLLHIPRDDQGNWSLQQLPAQVDHLLSAAQRSGQTLVTVDEEDHPRQVMVSRIPLSPSGNRAGQTLFALRDMTAQQAAQNAQAEFLSQISHELKAPLNTIVTYVEALADESLLSQEERREFFNTLNAEAMRMARLIGNLLQLSRIQLGNLSAQFGLVKPATLILELTEALRAQAETRGQSLQVDVPENLPALRGDKDLLAVSITNLITNAIKYTPQGGRIAIRATESEGGIVIAVEDSGIGIPEDARARIFERFVRSDQPEVRDTPGSGLGLALVKEIVEIHEGHITVQSQLGAGSVFQIWLPIREVGTRLDIAAA